MDFLGFTEPSEDRLRAIFADILAVEVQDEGVRFDESTLSAGPIREKQDCGGVRLVFFAEIAGARVRLQVDVGFGDAITPDARNVDFPRLLDFPAPKLRAYPPETVVAEKLEAMVKLGHANSRMKDFYDLAVLASTIAFEGGLLARAIEATFTRRGTSLPKALPLALTSEFTDDSMKETQWRAFLRKSGAPSLGKLRDVAATIAVFVEEPLAAAAGATFVKRWMPGGPWV